MNGKSNPLLTRRGAALLLAGGAAMLVAARRPVAHLSSKLTSSSIGAHIYGDPAAKVRLVEYFSYTCNHCAHFAAESAAPVKTLYLDKGLVAFEYRNLIRDPLDMTAALLALCGGPADFYANYQAIFANQPVWLDKAAKMPPEQMKSWYQGSIGARVRKMAADTGLDDLMRRRGYSDVQIGSALDDGVALAEITAMTNLAQTRDRITATPSFLINGKLLDDVHAWAPLKVRLDQAVRAA